MKRKIKIEEIIKQNFNLEFCKVEDVSESHRGHNGFVEGKETHFNILIVTDDFETLNRINRHRIVNKLLINQFKKGLHAVSFELLTKKEYK